MTDLIEKAAAEVRGMESRNPWRKALLIAACVEKGKGDRSKSRSELNANGKVSAQGFVAEVNPDDKPKLRGFSVNVILQNLEAWKKASEDGLVPPSEDLLPEAQDTFDDDELPDPEAWNEYYPPGGSDLQQAGAERRQKIEDAAVAVEASAATVARFAAEPKGVAGAILANEKAYEAAKAAVRQVEERKDAEREEKYKHFTFTPEEPDDFHLNKMFEARSALERAVTNAQQARRLMRDLPVTQNVKDTLGGLIGRLSAATDDLRMFVQDDPEFEAGVARMATGESEK